MRKKTPEELGRDFDEMTAGFGKGPTATASDCSAFPQPYVEDPNQHAFAEDFGRGGMTLRDFFAAQVAGHVFGQLIATGSHYEPASVANDAYAIAEAMMIRRQNAALPSASRPPSKSCI